MYRIFKQCVDSYITDRIISGRFRAIDANVGHASTLDLFKLFDESTLSGTTQPVERSRILVKFDLNELRALTSSVDITDPSFNVRLKLFDVAGGQPRPADYSVAVNPLSRSWDEGIGRDVGTFNDLDVVNWVTASMTNGLVAWHVTGASASGLLGSSDIDIIASGDLNDGLGIVDLTCNQTFTGVENLDVDVTNIISGTLAGLIPDCGFRIAFSAGIEADSGSYFVKRFASRHVSDTRIRPQLIVKYDDSLQDDHNTFTFDTTGSLYLFNYVRGQPRNLLSGSAASQLTGSSALTLKLISGSIAPVTSQSFTATFAVDQLTRGNIAVSGVYKSMFAVSAFEPQLRQEIDLVGSATFHVIWGSNDATVPFMTSSLVVKKSDVRSSVVQDRQLNVTLPNHMQVYKTASKSRVRVLVHDMSPSTNVMFTRVPIEPVSLNFSSMYWQLVDVYTGNIIIPFDVDDASTRVSLDNVGMYFDFWPGDLSIGRVYAFEFMIVDNNEVVIISKNLPTFRVEP